MNFPAVIDLVRETAADEIMPRFRRLDPDMVAAKTAPDDLVTEADRAMEARLTAALPGLLPGAVVIGEEAVSADARVLDGLAGAELAVVVDPVDGTWNFANGLAVFGVILAVVARGETVFGLLYDPVGDDWVAAERGGGAWFGRAGHAEKLRAAPAVPVAEATGFVPLYLFPPERRAAVAALLPDFARTQSLRCSCHEYRLVAQGRMHFNLSANLSPWDHLAGALAVSEAGGIARLACGGPYRVGPHVPGPLVAAGSAEVWEAVAARFG